MIPAVAANLSPGSYAYLDSLLSLEATSRPAAHYNRVVGFLPLHEWEPFLSLFQDQHFAAFLRRASLLVSDWASTQHLTSDHPSVTTHQPLPFPPKWTIISGMRWRWVTWAGPQTAQVPTSVLSVSSLKRTNQVNTG